MQTDRSLDHCLVEHQQALNNVEVMASALADHVFTAVHQVDLSKATMTEAHLCAQTCCNLET